MGHCPQINSLILSYLTLSYNISELDECVSFPCVHGTCHNGINQYTCTCGNSGYDGTNCELGNSKFYWMAGIHKICLLKLNLSLKLFRIAAVSISVGSIVSDQ